MQQKGYGKLARLVTCLIIAIGIPLLAGAQLPSEITIAIVADIDGRSQLVLHGNTAQWHHFDFAAPGRQEGTNFPTTINNIDWHPIWPDIPDAENRFCGCLSDVLSGVTPTLPTQPTDVSLQILSVVRDDPQYPAGTVAIVQFPTLNNNFTTIVEFDDNGPPGSAFYDVRVRFTAPSLISNGSFEQGTNPGPEFITLPAGSTAMTNWVVTSGTVDYIGPYWTAAAGQRSVDLNGNDPGAISQAFKTKPGTTYAVRFAMAGNPDGPPTTKRLHVSAAGETAELTFNAEGRSLQEMGYEKRTFLFTATSPQTTLAFTTLNPGPYGPAIDDVTVNETALGNVDNLVHFTPDSRSYHTTTDATGCPSGFIGKFSFTATLGAKPTSPPLSSLVVKVAQLSNSNLLQNADGGPSGVGGLLTIPGALSSSYQDGVLTEGEKIQHIPFTICLMSKASFSFFVDVVAMTGK
jgi:choice-of-anchor C domain-containing protein